MTYRTSMTLRPILDLVRVVVAYDLLFDEGLQSELHSSDVLRHPWAQFTRALCQEADKRWRVRRIWRCLSPVVAHSLVDVPCKRGADLHSDFVVVLTKRQIHDRFVYQRVELHIALAFPPFLRNSPLVVSPTIGKKLELMKASPSSLIHSSVAPRQTGLLP